MCALAGQTCAPLARGQFVGEFKMCNMQEILLVIGMSDGHAMRMVRTHSKIFTSTTTTALTTSFNKWLDPQKTHSLCRPKVNDKSECDFGVLKDIIIPPYAVSVPHVDIMSNNKGNSPTPMPSFHPKNLLIDDLKVVSCMLATLIDTKLIANKWCNRCLLLKQQQTTKAVDVTNKWPRQRTTTMTIRKVVAILYLNHVMPSPRPIYIHLLLLLCYAMPSRTTDQSVWWKHVVSQESISYDSRERKDDNIQGHAGK